MEGRITISRGVIAEIAARTVARCYGVVGMAPGARARVTSLLPRRRNKRGIAVSSGEEGVELDLRVVVEHGLNLAEVASTVRSQVTYEVERLTGLRVSSVDVHIERVRQSA
jgi:uncharacterized alkaline shock family protein YloU